MADVFKKDSAGIRRLLQSKEVLEMTKRYALGRAGGEGEIKSFIGFDRAKTFVYKDSSGKE